MCAATYHPKSPEILQKTSEKRKKTKSY